MVSGAPATSSGGGGIRAPLARMPKLAHVTAPWPTWTPPAHPQAAPRRPSLLVVVGVAVLCLVLQALVVLGAATGLSTFGGRLRDAVPLPASSATASPNAEPARATPEQTVAPVAVTEEVTRGVVLVSGQTPNQAVAGTGMILTADGLVMTNYHVVRSTESLTVTVAATGKRYPAALVGRDATHDVALLKLSDARGLEPVKLDDGTVRVGDIAIVAGNANGQGYVTANRGNVLATDRSIQVQSAYEHDPPETLRGLIETNAPAWPGNSGGPMFDADLEIIGMTTAGTSLDSETDRHVFAVPLATVLGVVDRIRSGDESGTVVIGPRPYLGVVAETDETNAVVVRRVESGTPASRAGIAAGDTLTAVGDTPIGTRTDLARVLDDFEPGQTVAVTWITPSGAQKRADVRLGESPLN